MRRGRLSLLHPSKKGASRSRRFRLKHHHATSPRFLRKNPGDLCLADPLEHHDLDQNIEVPKRRSVIGLYQVHAQGRDPEDEKEVEIAARDIIKREDGDPHHEQGTADGADNDPTLPEVGGHEVEVGVLNNDLVSERLTLSNKR